MTNSNQEARPAAWPNAAKPYSIGRMKAKATPLISDPKTAARTNCRVRRPTRPRRRDKTGSACSCEITATSSQSPGELAAEE